MTDLAGATADVSNLAPFEGKPVLRTTVAITGAGDGLSESMRIEPAEYHQGDKLYVVLECEVAEVQFKPLDKGDAGGAQIRVHKLKAGTATIMDEEVVGEAIAQQADRIAVAKERAEGITRMEFPDGDATGGSDDPTPEGEDSE